MSWTDIDVIKDPLLAVPHTLLSVKSKVQPVLS
jgi:hypothetical protein